MTAAEILERCRRDAPRSWFPGTLRTLLEGGGTDLADELLRRLGTASLSPGNAMEVERAFAFDERAAARLIAAIAAGVRPITPPEAIASFLATACPRETLETLVTAHAASDHVLPLFACLVSEAALRGKPLRNARGAPVVDARLRESGHPFATLPWVATPLEAEVRCLPLPDARGGSSLSIPFGPRQGMPLLPERADPVPAPTEAPPMPLPAAAEAVSEFHTSLAFGARLEAAAAGLSRALLVSARLPVLEGVPADRIYLESLRPEDAFELLLVASLGSVPYEHDRGVGLARWRAWRGLGQLAGMEAVDPPDVEAIEGEVRRCEWAYFDAPGWFIQEYCDLGIIALRPDRRSLAMVAGTATD